MKKKVLKPDGSTEEVEGTPEEIAEYERRLRGEVAEAPKKKGPRVLTDEKRVDFQKMMEELLDRKRKEDEERYGPPQVRFVSVPWWRGPFYDNYPRRDHAPTCQMKVAENGWWCVNPPMCTCGLILYPTTELVPCTVQTTTGDGTGDVQTVTRFFTKESTTAVLES